MLTDRVARAIRRHRILEPGDRVLVAVSAGPDSLALLAIMRDLVPDFGFNLKVAHFDHRWRPDSAADADFVEGVAGNWGFRFLVGRAPESGLARSEDAARKARYQFLRGAARDTGANAIAVGHTRDDQAETLLLHLLRGSGSHGLSAMRRSSPTDGRVVLVRPLLDFSRIEVEEFLRERGLTPHQDPSNEDPRFLRNRLRQNVLPALDGFDPAARRLLARAADILAEEDSFLDGLSQQLDAHLVEDRNAFRALAPAMQRRLLRRVRPGLTFGEVEAWRLDAGSPMTLEGSSARGRSKVQVSQCHCDPASFRGRDQVGHVDATTIAPPFEVMTRQPGDRIQPLGFGHQKKLQDVLVDAHVPRHLRDALPVVHDSQGIVWIPGVTVDERRRVTPATQVQWHLEIVNEIDSA